MNEYPPSQQVPAQQRLPPQMVRVSTLHVVPVATYSILILTVCVYLLQVAGQYLVKTDSWTALGLFVTSLGDKSNTLIRAGQLWRLLTPVFLHDTSLPYGGLHLVFNMFLLHLYGRGLESRYGHVRFMLLYFLSAFAGNVFSFMLSPENTLGSSPAIYGLLAAEAVFLLQKRKVMRSQVSGSLLGLLVMAAINIYLGRTSVLIDNFAHIGGLLGGLVFAWFGGPRWKLEGTLPSLQMVDEREGHGAVAGVSMVLLIFLPLVAVGWLFPR
jgi:rhomboid protease GluP